MTKYIKLSMITAMAVFSIVGCGSSSSSSVETGTGYYVDAAVKGVKYECGTIEGTTGNGGIFNFEKGEGCTFSLAGITLRTTKADDLRDGVKVVENNITVATLLQSIDANGDLSDGIEITDDVLGKLKDALEILELPEGKVPEGQELYYVVEAAGGHVRTEEEVREHLTQTQIEITLVGKTVYEYHEDGNDDSVIDAITFGEDGTITINHNGVTKTISYRIDGNKIYTIEDGVEKTHILIESTDKYIKFDDIEDEDVTTFYFTREDVGSESADCSYNLEDLIGKTYYITTDDSYTDDNGDTINNAHVETLNFNADGKTLNITWTENEETKSYTMSYSVSNDTLTISGTDADGNAVNESLKAPVTETSDYISFSGYDGRFFKTYDAAEAALESER